MSELVTDGRCVKMLVRVARELCNLDTPTHCELRMIRVLVDGGYLEYLDDMDCYSLTKQARIADNDGMYDS